MAADISATALDNARLNAELNGLQDRIEFVHSDVFELLEKLRTQPHAIDYLILDPPAFTKSRRTLHNAAQGYLRLNTLALRLLPRGGLFASASCSHFMKDDLFEAMLVEASRQAGVQLRQIEVRHQAPDHPILPEVPETQYLKFYLFQVI